MLRLLWLPTTRNGEKNSRKLSVVHSVWDVALSSEELSIDDEKPDMTRNAT